MSPQNSAPSTQSACTACVCSAPTNREGASAVIAEDAPRETELRLIHSLWGIWNQDSEIKLFPNFGNTAAEYVSCFQYQLLLSLPIEKGTASQSSLFRGRGWPGAFCSHQGANMTADRAWRLQSILLRRSGQKAYCEGPTTLRTPHGGLQLVLKAGFHVRDTGLRLNLGPV